MSKPKTTYSGAALRAAAAERLAAQVDPAERTRRTLASHERVIESARRSFVDMGRALLAIRTERLYAEEFSTFSEYCESRWDLSETHVNRVINAALVAIEATPIGVEINSEAVARELVGLGPEMLRQVWDEATRRAAGGRVTALLVKEVRRSLEHPAIDGEAVETKTSPGTAVLGSGEEGAADNSGSAVPSEPEDHTDEESDPVVAVADSSAPPVDEGLQGGAPAEPEEQSPASVPADEGRVETGVPPLAPAPEVQPREIPQWLLHVTAVSAAVHDLINNDPFAVAEAIDMDLAATLGESTAALLGWYRSMQEAFNAAEVTV